MKQLDPSLKLPDKILIASPVQQRIKNRVKDHQLLWESSLFWAQLGHGVFAWPYHPHIINDFIFRARNGSRRIAKNKWAP